MKILKPALLVLVAAFVVLQFIRPERNDVAVDPAMSLTAVFDVPPDVQQMLTVACNDCHSNATRYPWYAEIQPVAWWLNDHITEGRKHLNFSEFGSYRLTRQHHKLEEIGEMVSSGEMPLPSYTLAHWDARLTDEQRKRLVGWAEAMRATLEQQYPDSLKR